MFLTRRIGLPFYFLLLLLLALSLNLVRGFDLAQRHHRQLVPQRVDTVLDLRSSAASELTVDSRQRYLLVRLPEDQKGPMALREILPERTLLRWQEKASGDGDWLVVPLTGLQKGEFGLCRSSQEGTESVQLEERLDNESNWLGRFRIE